MKTREIRRLIATNRNRFVFRFIVDFDCLRLCLRSCLMLRLLFFLAFSFVLSRLYSSTVNLHIFRPPTSTHNSCLEIVSLSVNLSRQCELHRQIETIYSYKTSKTIHWKTLLRQTWLIIELIYVWSSMENRRTLDIDLRNSSIGEMSLWFWPNLRGIAYTAIIASESWSTRLNRRLG